MEANESIERFNESMKKSISRAKELGKLMKYKPWLDIATSLENRRLVGLDLARKKSLNKQEINENINNFQAMLSVTNKGN